MINKTKIKLCGKPMPKAKNGADRGFCQREFRHTTPGCGNGTCCSCGIKLKLTNVQKSGNCGSCNTKRTRLKRGYKPRNSQFAGSHHVFPCGCSGFLPEKGKSNGFARWNGIAWHCRIQNVICVSICAGRKFGHFPIDPSTPHFIIRAMMEQPCVFCGKVLNWDSVGAGKTPHCDHDHQIKNNNVNGFACAGCNPQDLKNENKRLRKELMELKKEYTRCDQCGTHNPCGDECKECGADLRVEPKVE